MIHARNRPQAGEIQGRVGTGWPWVEFSWPFYHMVVLEAPINRSKMKEKIRAPNHQGSGPSTGRGPVHLIHWMSSEPSCTHHVWSGAFSLP